MPPDASPHSSRSPPLSEAVAPLLRHFHRQSPIRGGSLLITIFGDSIAPRGGAVTLGSLISLAAPFELTERLVRTSVARLASDGWLAARRNGRRSEYRLSGVGLERFAEATRRIYGEIPSSWDGRWTLLVLPSGARPKRSEGNPAKPQWGDVGQRRESREASAATGAPGTGSRRQDVRNELRWLGFGQINPGVFAHPNWSIQQARAALDGLDGTANALLLKSESEGSEVDRRLAASGWDLGDLTRRYRRFVDIFSPVLEAVMARASSTTTGNGTPDGDNDLPAETGFVIRTLLVHEYRKIHLQDPLLPQALLPSDWVGAAAYVLCKRLYSAVFAAAERYLSHTASTMTEPLPPADGSAYRRFGGLEPD